MTRRAAATRFVPDERYETAPRLPTDRPPTRREVWERLNHLYYDLKTPAQIATLAKGTWLFAYVWAVNLRGWDKPPDWQEGQAVVAAACPRAPIPFDRMEKDVYGLLDAASTDLAA